MKHRWLVVAGIVFSLFSLVSVAIADIPMRFIINGRELKPDIKPQIMNGQVMVPIRWLAEALGASLEWDREFNIIRVSTNPGQPEDSQPLPAVFKNAAGKFQGVEIPVYVPAYLPGTGPYRLIQFNSSKNGYSFEIVRADKTSPPVDGTSDVVSMADSVVTMSASDQPFSPFPAELKHFAIPSGTVDIAGVNVNSYGNGMEVTWIMGNWEFYAAGYSEQEAMPLARQILSAFPDGFNPVPGSIKGKFRAAQFGNPLLVTVSWTFDDKTWYTLDGRSSVDVRARMLQSITRLTPREPGGTKYYPRTPEKITTPEMALQAYFDSLYHAANLNPAQMAAAGGTVAMDREPYPTAYGYWSKEWQAENDYDKFLASWKGTVNVELLKLLPAGEADGRKRFFVETRHLEAAGEKPKVGYFYYTGFFTVAETADGWRISGGGLEPENPGWKLGGHQPWRGDPEQVALVELAGSIDAPVGKAVSENNADGTVTVKFIDSIGKETCRAVLVQPHDGIWRVLDKR